MQLNYRIEGDIHNGKRFECQAFYQPASPNHVTATAHIQESVEFIYIKHGIYSAFVNQNKYTLYPGDLLFILSRDIHSLRAENCPKNGYYVLKIDSTMLYNPSDPSPYKYIIPFKLNKENKQCIWRKDELANNEILKTLNSIALSIENEEYAYDLNIKINCMNLLLWVLKEWNNNRINEEEKITDVSTPIYKSIEYIHKNYTYDITAMGCAHEIGLSYSYFSRQFSKIIGKSFREYLNTVRCNQAEKLLLTTDKSISDISFECGYNDLCYFISVFRKSRGMSPNKYRKKLFSDSK